MTFEKLCFTILRIRGFFSDNKGLFLPVTSHDALLCCSRLCQPRVDSSVHQPPVFGATLGQPRLQHGSQQREECEVRVRQRYPSRDAEPAQGGRQGKHAS